MTNKDLPIYDPPKTERKTINAPLPLEKEITQAREYITSYFSTTHTALRHAANQVIEVEQSVKNTWNQVHEPTEEISRIFYPVTAAMGTTILLKNSYFIKRWSATVGVFCIGIAMAFPETSKQVGNQVWNKFKTN
jgi:hypothetical protein